MATKDQKEQADLTTNMAGPETQRDDFKPPLPEEGTPVYYGGQAYQEQHKDGFGPEETRRAQEIASYQFDPATAGEGRVQNWGDGTPDRNRQGLTAQDLDDVTTSSIIDDPTLGDRHRQSNVQPVAPLRGSFKTEEEGKEENR